MKTMNLGYTTQAGKSQETKAIQGAGLDLFLGNQGVKNVSENVLEDRGKGFYNFSYETLTSPGPQKGADFTDPENQFKHLGTGKWHSEHLEPATATDSEETTTREYLIIGIWKYNSTTDSINLLREI